MNAAQWARAKNAFDSALDLSEGERALYLHELCGKDEELRAEVEQLLEADSRAGDFLLSPALLMDTVSLAADDIVCDRYRVLRPLGDGGMGQVYEAHDTELNIRVALKTLRPEIASNPEVLSRFRQEVRVALRITHPNICRTFHFDRDRKAGHGEGAAVDVLFLTMEFLEGETLQQTLKHSGPLSPERTFSIACQMASALEAAHQAGIIHRDIKPGNVMLCPDVTAPGGERVVVMDFGLAKSSHAASPEVSSISHAGMVTGTLAYMAPEQLEAGNVTPATDIYAFGLLLFEALTGQKAFANAGTLTAAFRRLVDPPPSPRTFIPDLPEPWNAAVVGCLQIDPAARFRRANDVIAVLEGADAIKLRNGGVTAATAARPVAAQLRTKALTRRVAMAAIVLICMSLSWWAFRLYQSKADAAVAPGTLVYLAPVKNDTGDKQLDNITELVRAGLSQSAHINLLDAGRVGDVLHSMTKPPDTIITSTTGREIAMRAGAQRVVFVSVAKSSSGYRLDIDLQQPDPQSPARSREHWMHHNEWVEEQGHSTDAVTPQLAAAIRSSSDWIRLRVGESDRDILRLDGSPDDVTTSSWRALSAYVDAEAFQNAGDTTKAVLALQEAAALDPHFSLALGRLGDLLFSTGRYQDGLRAYIKALDPDQDSRLSRRERDRILGEFSIDSADYVAAERAYSDLALYYPNEYRGWSFRGYPLLMMGRTDAAIQTLKKAHSLDPQKRNPTWELARANVSVGAYPEALRWAAVLDQQGATESANYVRGTIHFLKKEYPEALASFHAMQQTDKTARRSWGYKFIARMAAERGDYTGAVNVLREGIFFDKQNGLPALEADKLLSLAYIEALQDDFRTCLRDVRSSLMMESSPQSIMVASSILGKAYPRANRAETLAIHAEILRLGDMLPHETIGVISEMARFRVLGEIALSNHDPKVALVEFHKAAALDAFANGREYLARALEAAAQNESDSAKAAEWRGQAMQAYGLTALRPNLLWFDSVDLLPGTCAQQSVAYLRLSRNTPHSASDADIALRNIEALNSRVPRPNPPTSQSTSHKL